MIVATRIYAQNCVNTGRSIIDRSKEESVRLLRNGVSDKYSALKEDPIVQSYSIDGIKNYLVLFIYKKVGNDVGEDYPDHYLYVQTDDNAATKLRDIIDFLQ